MNDPLISCAQAPLGDRARYQKDSCSRNIHGQCRHFSLKFVAGALSLALFTGGCAVGPRHEMPTRAAPVNWKELPAAQGWIAAAPADALDRGAWWTLFGDPVLDQLAARVEVSNQTIAAAVANQAQAEALLRQQRAALLPSIALGGSATRAKSGAKPAPANSFGANLSADWAPDVWGRLRSAVTGAEASAQASQADLASARLSAVGTLATSYFTLRETDAAIGLLDETITGYGRALEITTNSYNAGISAQTDVLQAQTQLANARAGRVAQLRARATLEHAIAVLVGQAPADFSLPPAHWTPTVPGVPVAVPSALLQRRPDIAAAERAVAAANAQIGVARSAYFPNLSLSASVGSNASRIGDLFSAPNTLWSLGLSVAQVVFDGGAIGAGVDAANAARAASVARYRQTVLVAFQSVEDQLTALATLAQQEGLQREASIAADKVEQQSLNQYRAGQVNYTNVVTAQVAALNARSALVQTQVARQNAAVALIQALGGGWQAPWAPPG